MNKGKVTALSPNVSDLETKTLADIRQMDFPAPSWIVPGLMPEGLTLLCGASKIGKSWLTMKLAFAVAGGGPTLNGLPVMEGEVLYIALEDTYRRIQDRDEILEYEMSFEAAKKLHFITSIPKMDQGGITLLKEWLEKHPDCKMVVIDTLQRFRPGRQRGDAYAEDYETMGMLHKIAVEYRIGMVAIHHTRKLESADPYDRVSGTTALMGAADTTWILTKKRSENTATLNITGRDVSEQELILLFDPSTCQWSVSTSPLDLNYSDEELQIVELMLASHIPIGPKDLLAVGDITLEAAKTRFSRMRKSGKIIRTGRGQYTLPDCVLPVLSEESEASITLK